MAKKIIKKKKTSATEGVMGYSVKQKKKVLMSDVVVNKNGNRYMAKGVAANAPDQNMAAIMGKDAALEAIEKGWAEKGDGWD